MLLVRPTRGYGWHSSFQLKTINTGSSKSIWWMSLSFIFPPRASIYCQTASYASLVIIKHLIRDYNKSLKHRYRSPDAKLATRKASGRRCSRYIPLSVTYSCNTNTMNAIAEVSSILFIVPVVRVDESSTLLRDDDILRVPCVIIW